MNPKPLENPMESRVFIHSPQGWSPCPGSLEHPMDSTFPSQCLCPPVPLPEPCPCATTPGHFPASPGLSSGFQSPLSLWDVPKGLEMSPQAWDVPKELEMSLRNWKCPQGLECPLRGGMSPLGRDSSPAAPRASTSVPTPWGPRVIYWRGRSLPPPGGTAWDRDTVGVPPAEEEPPLCDFYFAADGILCVLTNSVVCESFLGLNL